LVDRLLISAQKTLDITDPGTTDIFV